MDCDEDFGRVVCTSEKNGLLNWWSPIPRKLMERLALRARGMIVNYSWNRWLAVGYVLEVETPGLDAGDIPSME